MCTPRHPHSHDKSVSSDAAKKSTFSDATAFSDAQKTCVPRHSYSLDKSVFSDTAKSQRLVTLRKDVHPGIHHTASVFNDTAKKRGVQ